MLAIVVGLSPWAISTLGLATLLIGSALFAVATWLTKSLSPAASALLVVVHSLSSLRSAAP